MLHLKKIQESVNQSGQVIGQVIELPDASALILRFYQYER